MMEVKNAPQLYNESSMETTKDFILALETLPILWDKRHVHYRDRFKRSEALRTLLAIYKKLRPFATISDVRKKINSLKSNYRREVRKIITSRRSGAVKDTPRNWTFQFLRFLDDVDEIQIPDGDEESNISNEDLHETDEFESKEAIFTPIPSINPTPSPQSRSSNIKGENSRQASLKVEYEYMSQPSIRNPIVFDWSETLDRLDPMQRLYAKKAINDVLYEAELGKLTRNSVQINVTHPYISHSPPLSQESPYAVTSSQPFHPYNSAACTQPLILNVETSRRSCINDRSNQSDGEDSDRKYSIGTTFPRSKP